MTERSEGMSAALAGERGGPSPRRGTVRTLTGVAVAAGLVLAVTGCGLSVGRHQQDRSYDGPSGVTTLKVKAHGGRVEIVASDSPGIKVRERLRWSNDHNKPKAQHVTEGGTLSLSAKCARNVIGPNACGVSYRIEVPRSLGVDVVTGDGTITASGLAGTVRLKAGSGSITATDLRTSSLSAESGDGGLRVSGRAGTADLHTGTGSITMTGLTADRLTAHSGDGGIRLSGRATTAGLRTDTGSINADGLTADRVVARTGDGGILIGLTTPPTDVQATTQTGSVRVRLPRGQGYAIDASTGTGSKEIDPAVHHDSQSPRHVKISTGDGGITVSPA